MVANPNFTQGNIGKQLIRFATPILLALILQTLYGAVDLLIVGKFGTARDVASVANGVNMMATITFLIAAMAIGSTVLIGQAVGAGRREEASRAMGASIAFFFVFTLSITIIMIFATRPFAVVLNTPEEALDGAVLYTRICSGGAVFIVAYNLLGSIFRGFGDSKTPLITVALASVFNIVGDLILVGAFRLGPVGAASATVTSQALSVFFSILIVRKSGLPFDFKVNYIKFDKVLTKKIIKIGTPIAFQDGLVSVSFLVIAAIINSLGVQAAAGVGVADRVAVLFLIVPAAFSHSLSAYVAQNVGAKKYDRARQALFFAVKVSLVVGVVMFYITFFHGDMLSRIFIQDEEVIELSAAYLRAYSFDAFLTPFLFCFHGYFNGHGRTMFIMGEGIVGAIGVRTPAAFILSKIMPASLFGIGLAMPCSTLVQIVLCLIYYNYLNKKQFLSQK